MIECKLIIITRVPQIDPMRKHFQNMFSFLYIILSHVVTTPFRYLPPSPSCFNDLYSIAFECTTFYA